MKVCTYCNCVNDDDATFCKNCGNLLYNENNLNFNKKYSRKFILAGYILSFIFGWGGLVLTLFSSLTNSMFFIGFFGLIFPFNLIRSDDRDIGRAGYIQLLICLSGVFLQILLLFYLF